MTAPNSDSNVVPPVITAEQLMMLQRSGLPVVIADCRFNLSDQLQGRREYEAAHISGAVYVDLERDLSGLIVRGQTGRHPLPEPSVFAATAGRLGIDNETLVVGYDDGSCMFAPRLWWLLRWLGHAQVSVLQGGIDAWAEAGGALNSVIPKPPSRTLDAHIDSTMVASLNDVEQLATSQDARLCLLDARAEVRFRGEQEPIDPVAGHIPGAKNLPFTTLLHAGGPKSAPEVEQRLTAAIAPYAPNNTIAYCGSGVTACALIWAAASAGITGVRLYPGSWSEWVTSPARPVARG